MTARADIRVFRNHFGVALAGTGLIAGLALAQAGGEPAVRSREVIGKELTAVSTELKSLIPGDAVLRDSVQRARIAEKAVAALLKQGELLQELSASSGGQALDPARVKLGGSLRRLRTEPLLIAFGHPKTIASVSEEAGASDPAAARFARAEQLTASYLTAADEAGQLKVVGDVEQILKDGADDQVLDYVIAGLVRRSAVSQKVSDQLASIVTAQGGKQARAAIEQAAGAKLLKSFEGKPITLAGTTPDGKAFTTEDWKGKVVLVDFWATWCGPCKAELPRVKALYKQYHEKGFEILGVSNDYTLDALTKFIAADPELSWTQIVDADAVGARKWHPLTQKYGIKGIPVMFLIDRHGVLRSVEARANLEGLLPKLLEEPVAEAR